MSKINDIVTALNMLTVHYPHLLAGNSENKLSEAALKYAYAIKQHIIYQIIKTHYLSNDLKLGLDNLPCIIHSQYWIDVRDLPPSAIFKASLDTLKEVRTNGKKNILLSDLPILANKYRANSKG